MSPIHIEVYVNQKPIHSWHIGRVLGGTKEDDVNVYLVSKGPIGVRADWASEENVEFMHRYGDGIDVCIQRGLQAALGDAPTITTLLPEPERTERN